MSYLTADDEQSLSSLLCNRLWSGGQGVFAVLDIAGERIKNRNKGSTWKNKEHKL